MTPGTNPGAGPVVWSRRRLLSLLSVAALARPAKAGGAVVEIRQFKFEPAEIEIAAGATVTFVNLDLVPHTATGTQFDTGSLQKGERMEIEFPAAGEFSYLCGFHRHMTGRVVVR